MNNNDSAVKLSVVILNHNSGRMLLDCLNSFLAVQYPFSIEVIIPDNGSTDNSLDLAQKEWDGRITIIRNNANHGFSWGNNIGIRACRGEYVCLLNPDTIIGGDALTTLIAFMDRQPEAGIIGPKVLNKDGSFQLSAIRSIPHPFDAISRALLLSKIFPKSRRFARYNQTYLDTAVTQRVDASTGCCMLARRKMIDEIGMLDEHFFIYCEDVDWFLRAKNAGWETWYVAEAVIEHHHAYSERFRKYKAVRNFHDSMVYFYRKHYATHYPAVMNAGIYCAVYLRMAAIMAKKTLKRWK